MSPTSDAPTGVLVIGGAAFLGRHVVPALLAHDDRTVGVLDLRSYEGPGAERVSMHLGDATSDEVLDAVLGSGRYEAVVWMATPNLMTATAEAFERVNVHGMRGVVSACQRHGVKALVYIASIAVMNHFVAHVDVDETAPLPDLGDYRIPYDRTKRLGEDAALGGDAPGGLRTCSLRLGGVLSDLDDVTLRYATPPVAVMMSRGARIDMIDGRSAAHGIELAVRGLLERPDEVGGEAFFLTRGESVRAYDYFRWVAHGLGHRVVVVPGAVRSLVHGTARLSHAIRARLGLRVPGVPLHLFLDIQEFEQTFDNRKARDVLGFAPLGTLEEAVQTLVDEWRARPET